MQLARIQKLKPTQLIPLDHTPTNKWVAAITMGKLSQFLGSQIMSPKFCIITS